MKIQPRTKIVLAGYGLLRDKEFVELLLQRSLSDFETEQVLEGCQLRIVSKPELSSPLIQNDPEIPDTFRIYGLVSTEKKDDKVKVRLLELTPEEYQTIRILNFENEVFESRIKVNGPSYIVEELKDPTLGIPVDGLSYDPFLNGRDSIPFLVEAVRTEASRRIESNFQSRERRV